jgi:ABC-2 type transport system ATP-binding protein
MSGSAVEIDGLSKKFGDITALDNVSFDVAEGEMFCIVGPDGAGKTTLLRTLCGIVHPSSGSAHVFGHDVGTEIVKIKPLIGYLSQKFSLYGDLTIDENIEFFAEIHGVRSYATERDRLLEFTRLAPYRTRLAEKLSGGMKQKLALACTLIHTPKVLFLDEPSTGVDPVSRRDFWLILAGLLENGLTIVMTTPYMDEAERASRVGLLDRGNILMVDTPSGIRNSMQAEILEISCERTREAADLLESSGDYGEIELFGDRVAIVIGNGGKSAPVLRVLKKGGIDVRSWRVIRPGLEHVFISLMRAPRSVMGERGRSAQKMKRRTKRGGISDKENKQV